MTIKRTVIMLLLTIILFSLLFSTMIVHADSSKSQKYIVVNKRNDTLSIIEIPYKLNDWEFGFDAKKGITLAFPLILG